MFLVFFIAIHAFGSQKKMCVCSRCGVAFYCSKEHQKAHWKTHKAHCSVLKERGILRGDQFRKKANALIMQPKV